MWQQHQPSNNLEEGEEEQLQQQQQQQQPSTTNHDHFGHLLSAAMSDMTEQESVSLDELLSQAQGEEGPPPPAANNDAIGGLTGLQIVQNGIYSIFF